MFRKNDSLFLNRVTVFLSLMQLLIFTNEYISKALLYNLKTHIFKTSRQKKNPQIKN